MRILQSPLQQTAAGRQAMIEEWQLFGDPSEIVFLDIETTGFSRLYDSVYLIGMLYMEPSMQGLTPVVRQYLAGSVEEESKVLRQALDELRRFSVCVTYNGSLFDLPFMEEKSKRLRIWSAEDQQWITRMRLVDLLRQYRRYQSFFGWPNMRLTTLEKEMGETRRDPFNGGQLIEVFHEYARSDDPKLEAVLLLHNYEDMIYLPSLLRIEGMMRAIHKAQILQARYVNGALLLDCDTLFPLSHRAMVSLGRKKKKDAPQLKAQYNFEAASPRVTITLPSCDAPLYYYLPNAKDYYFLPQSGQLVHRSLAYDVPAAERRKAKKEECVLSADPPGGGPRQYVRVPDTWKAMTGSGLRLYQKQYKGEELYAAETELGEWLLTKPEEETASWCAHFLELL